MNKPVYVPAVHGLGDDGYEQVFAASFVSLTAEDGVAILGLTEEEGAPVHALIVSWPEREPFGSADVYVEFNDQANGCQGSEVTLAIGGGQLVVEYSASAAVRAGRISYSDDIDPLREPARDYKVPLRRVVVDLRLHAESNQKIAKALEVLRRNGVRVDGLSEMP